VVGSQSDTLTPDPSFGHNLSFKYANESCEPILNIYISRYFQWYKEIFNLMNFDPCNFPLKIWESIRTPTPNVGVHLGMWGFIPSHSFILLGIWNVIPKFHSCPVPSQALTLVVSPKLGLQHMWRSLLDCDVCAHANNFHYWPHGLF
jgi:hypothetical protein